MRHGGGPRVAHFNDCANVAFTLVEAAKSEGLDWSLLPPDRVRPPGGFSASIPGRLRALPYIGRHLRMLSSHDVIHVHYATAAALLEKRYLPARPYVLHLHGTDIREQWADPAYHDQIQRAIDGAHTVYYANLDTAANALRARADAQYFPIMMRTDALPAWRPASDHGPARVIFASRWDASKGADDQLRVATALKAGLPSDVELEGLDWGVDASKAEAAGVRLRPRMSHRDFLSWLATADVVIGQAKSILATSELEAMAIGPTVLCPVPQLVGPAGPPPVAQTSMENLVEATREILADPRTSSVSLAARDWVERHHTADRWVPVLSAVYQQAAAGVRGAQPSAPTGRDHLA